MHVCIRMPNLNLMTGNNLFLVAVPCTELCTYLSHNTWNYTVIQVTILAESELIAKCQDRHWLATSWFDRDSSCES